MHPERLSKPLSFMGADGNQLWELSSPRRLRRRRHCQHLNRLTHRYRSLAKARELPQEDLPCQAELDFTCELSFDNDRAQLWELSSPSEAAKGPALLACSSPDPPLSQPR